MSTTPSRDRSFIVALTAAVASTTLAVGVTAGALLGWIGPRTTPDEPGSTGPAGDGSARLIYVPITPSAPPAPPPIDPPRRASPVSPWPTPARVPTIATIAASTSTSTSTRRTTMTEPGEARRRLAALDGKLYAVAVVAVAYLIAWYEVSATPRPVAATAPSTPRAVWIDQLPEADRPAAVRPAGWRVASPDEQVVAPPLVRVPAPASRPLRVRTRSS